MSAVVLAWVVADPTIAATGGGGDEQDADGRWKTAVVNEQAHQQTRCTAPAAAAGRDPSWSRTVTSSGENPRGRPAGSTTAQAGRAAPAPGCTGGARRRPGQHDAGVAGRRQGRRGSQLRCEGGVSGAGGGWGMTTSGAAAVADRPGEHRAEVMQKPRRPRRPGRAAACLSSTTDRHAGRPRAHDQTLSWFTSRAAHGDLIATRNDTRPTTWASALAAQAGVGPTCNETRSGMAVGMSPPVPRRPRRRADTAHHDRRREPRPSATALQRGVFVDTSRARRRYCEPGAEPR